MTNPFHISGFKFGWKPYVPTIYCCKCGKREERISESYEERELCLECNIAYTQELLAVKTIVDYRRFNAKWAQPEVEN